MAKPRSRSRRPGSTPLEEGYAHLLHFRVGGTAKAMLEDKANKAAVSVGTYIRRLVYRGLGLIHEEN